MLFSFLLPKKRATWKDDRLIRTGLGGRRFQETHSQAQALSLAFTMSGPHLECAEQILTCWKCRLKNIHNLLVENYVLWEFLGFKAWETASQVTLRELF